MLQNEAQLIDVVLWGVETIWVIDAMHDGYFNAHYLMTLCYHVKAYR